jgi:putative transposase
VLLGLARCGVCRRPATPDAEELALMRWLDEQYLATPFYGSRIGAVLRLTARRVNRKPGRAAGKGDGLEALDPKAEDQPTLGAAPDLLYLLRGLAIG